MLKMTQRYAEALLDFAEEHGLEAIYRQAMILAISGNADPAQAPEALGSFLALIPGGDDEALTVLYRFLDIARERMNLLECEIISAVPLTPEQIHMLEGKLIRMLRKQLDIHTTVDPSILGGLRVIVGGTVLDDTIARKLRDMKNAIYEGVYLKQ